MAIEADDDRPDVAHLALEPDDLPLPYRFYMHGGLFIYPWI